MVRATVLPSILVALASCASKPQTVEPQTVLSEVVTDPSGRVQVDVRYNQNPPDKIELIVALAAVGIEEMDKIAVDISTDAFAVLEGSSQWAGFVAPRSREQHRMLLRAEESADAGSVTVSVSRFHDSEVLWKDTATFTFTGTLVVAN
jgi:hypothetical protein